MSSGEHSLDLRDTDPCAGPDDPESERPTWPTIPPAPPVRLNLITAILDEEITDP